MSFIASLMENNFNLRSGGCSTSKLCKVHQKYLTRSDGIKTTLVAKYHFPLKDTYVGIRLVCVLECGKGKREWEIGNQGGSCMCRHMIFYGLNMDMLALKVVPAHRERVRDSPNIAILPSRIR